MWPEAKCGNRGRRTRLQWRLGRRVVVSYPRPELGGARRGCRSTRGVVGGWLFCRRTSFVTHDDDGSTLVAATFGEGHLGIECFFDAGRGLFQVA